MIGLLLLVAATATAQKQLVKKADKYYKLNAFSKAIPLYEEALAEKRSYAVQTKLANCYRMMNNNEAAEPLYAEAVQHKRARSITYYYYGLTLMNNAKYDEAREWFERYAAAEPEDERGPMMLNSLEQIKTLKPIYSRVMVTPYEYNSEVDDSAPVYWDTTLVFSSDRKRGLNPFEDEDAWTGRDYLNIYTSAYSGYRYQKPTTLPNRINQINKHVGPITFNEDGDNMVFTRNSDIESRANSYNMQLYSARYESGKWRDIQPLSFCSVEYNYMHPALSPDGETLYFVTDKRGGEGGTDIWVSHLEDGDWTKPTNVGPMINTPANEGFPYVDEFDVLYFCSKGHVGYGGFDIFRAEPEGPGLWSRPQNLGKPFNSSSDDLGFCFKPGSKRMSGAFSSSRSGNDDDIYLFEVQETQQVPVILTITEHGTPVAIDSAQVRVQRDGQTILTETVRHGSASILLADDADYYLYIKRDGYVTKDRYLPRIELQQNNPYQVALALRPDGPAADKTALPTDSLLQLVPDTTASSGIQLAVDSVAPRADTTSILPDSIPSDTTAEAHGSTIPDRDFKARGEATDYLPPITPVVPPPLAPPMTEPKEPAVIPTVNLLATAPHAKSAVLVAGDFEDIITSHPPQPGSVYRLEGKYPQGVTTLPADVAVAFLPWIDYLKAHPHLVIEIGCHTISTDQPAYSEALSIQRAEAAALYLIASGLPPHQLRAVGYGERQPVIDCRSRSCTPQEAARNQRVELKVISVD